mmetsp:Transcript_503/g.1449  ORF Transcript_503/g.1449 Transcript_503/m.1449 type:complete len:216 (+) Transcript_503:453-1100(+)
MGSRPRSACRKLSSRSPFTLSNPLVSPSPSPPSPASSSASASRRTSRHSPSSFIVGERFRFWYSVASLSYRIDSALCIAAPPSSASPRRSPCTLRWRTAKVFLSTLPLPTPSRTASSRLEPEFSSSTTCRILSLSSSFVRLTPYASSYASRPCWSLRAALLLEIPPDSGHLLLTIRFSRASPSPPRRLEQDDRLEATPPRPFLPTIVLVVLIILC